MIRISFALLAISLLESVLTVLRVTDDQTTLTHDSLASLVGITVSAGWGFDGVYCPLLRKRSIYVSALLLLRSSR